MPLLLEPKQRYAVVLESDKDKPEETQPRFWAYALSARESIANQKAISEVVDDEAIFPYLERLVVGWENMKGRDGKPIEFEATRIQDILTTKEAWELFGKINRNDHLSESDKKKSE